jgi:hypothetical protein
MSEISTDQSKNLKLTYRKGEGREITFTVVDSNGNPYDLSGLEFVLEVFDVFARDTNLFQLTEDSGGGITNGGVSGVLTINPSDDNVDLDEGVYEWRLRTTEPVTWFNAPFIINNSPTTVDVEDSVDVTIDLGAVNIDVTISLGTWTESITTNRQVDSYTLVLADASKLVEMNKATANDLTVPLNSAVAFPIGTTINVGQYGAGQTTIVPFAGVTIRSAGGALKLASQFSVGKLIKIDTDEWYLYGDITI